MAGYRGGYGGFGGGNQMQQLMKQAQKMQEQMAKAQEELEEAEIVGESGGLVKVTVNGKKVVKAISIAPAAVDPDDVEMLEDLIVAALNNAYEKADKLHDEKLGGLGGAGGLI